MLFFLHFLAYCCLLKNTIKYIYKKIASRSLAVCNMYIVTGSNLHGQWFETNPVLDRFQPITLKNSGISDTSVLKLIHISWSYCIFKDTNKYYLSGSIYGEKKKFIELPLPKELSNKQIVLCGNDDRLFLFAKDLLKMWVIDLENLEKNKIINLKTEVPSKIKQWKGDDNIVNVCATNFYSICLTAEGTVYSGLLPGPLDVSNCIGKVCDIQCGYEHYLLLTDTGHVYSWGNGRRLQLGHGDLSNIETPKEIEALSGINITKISTGGWHSLALSESGDLYAWGWNDTGQLGIKEIDQLNIDQSEVLKTSLNSHGVPTVVDIFDENGDTVNTNVKYIACGNLHSAIILEDNSVWTAGCNKYGQLGFSTETTKKVNYFKKAYQCSDEFFIKCGPWVTVIVEKLKHDTEEVFK